MTGIEWRKCPDSGSCNHLGCEAGGCFRVLTCEPLSGKYPHDRWPADVVDAVRRKVEAGAPLLSTKEALALAHHRFYCHAGDPLCQDVDGTDRDFADLAMELLGGGQS